MNANGKARTDAHWPAIRFTVNGEGRTVRVPPMKRLLDVLREAEIGRASCRERVSDTV